MDLKKIENMVYKYANNVQAKHNGILNLADLEAAGMRGLCEAERSFNPESGASFTTWCFMNARRYIQDEVRQQRKALSENVSVSLDEGSANVVDTLGCAWDIEDQINREQLHDMLMQQIRRLPSKQQKLMIAMLAQGMTQTDYAQRENLQKAAVNRLYIKAVSRLREYLSPVRSEISLA